VDVCGRKVESKPCRSGLCGRLWTPTDTAWRSTDQEVGGSSSSGRAAEIPAKATTPTSTNATAPASRGLGPVTARTTASPGTSSTRAPVVTRCCRYQRRCVEVHRALDGDRWHIGQECGVLLSRDRRVGAYRTHRHESLADLDLAPGSAIANCPCHNVMTLPACADSCNADTVVAWLRASRSPSRLLSLPSTAAANSSSSSSNAFIDTTSIP